MRAPALGRAHALPPREVSAEAQPLLVDAVNALLFGLTLAAAPVRVPTPTPIELACREAAEGAAALETAPHAHVSARALDGAAANDGPAPRKTRAAEGPSSAEVETMVRLAAARSTAPATQRAVTLVEPPVAAQPAAAPAPARQPVAVPALLSAHGAQVEFAEGGADATIEIAHPELGPIRLEVSLSSGGIALRALTPSTTTAAALRALEPAVARALAARGIPFRSLRVDVASDSRATVSRTHRRRRDFEEEA